MLRMRPNASRFSCGRLGAAHSEFYDPPRAGPRPHGALACVSARQLQPLVRRCTATTAAQPTGVARPTDITLA
jgi:hypothetical protein